jgi:epoxyqueuosine reductase
VKNKSSTDLIDTVRTWARELGFDDVGFTGVDLGAHEGYLQKWLDAGYQGTMDWMARHGTKRSRPDELVPGTCTVLSLRMDDLPEGMPPDQVLARSDLGYVSRYALGRDYHKVIRSKLALLAKKISDELEGGSYRAFVDSAPVLERAIAEQAGLGWIAKNTMLINESAGSWFFLGEIYTDIPLPPSPPQETKHCGSCTSCMTICPTQAFVAPWNKFAQTTRESDFQPRDSLDAPDLIALFQWSEEEFLQRLEGSPIRRIGYERWLRNIAVALGNAPTTPELVTALKEKLSASSPMVREHIEWALERHAIGE